MNNWDYSYLHIPQLNGILMDDVKNLLISNQKEKTLNHVIAVAEKNIQLAEKYNLEKEICFICGLLHDISAIIHPDDMLSYARNNNLYIDESEKRFPFILHQRLSKILAQELFKIDDPRILSAIECHSTLKNNPTDYDMSLFIADKLSWDKDGIPPYYDIVTHELGTSLERASLAYMNYIVDNKMILFPHVWFTDGKKFLERNYVETEK